LSSSIGSMEIIVLRDFSLASFNWKIKEWITKKFDKKKVIIKLRMKCLHTRGILSALQTMTPISACSTMKDTASAPEKERSQRNKMR
jgi:hypothetical protein